MHNLITTWIIWKFQQIHSRTTFLLRFQYLQCINCLNKNSNEMVTVVNCFSVHEIKLIFTCNIKLRWTTQSTEALKIKCNAADFNTHNIKIISWTNYYVHVYTSHSSKNYKISFFGPLLWAYTCFFNNIAVMIIQNRYIQQQHILINILFLRLDWLQNGGKSIFVSSSEKKIF